ncbi:MAG TPA: efflux RND transporter periplasmic adaptor subunit [Anaerolineales bacterium]|nr:efflux RND transporter periplasmic adaptor subunit [Anaerolineales bacterium]
MNVTIRSKMGIVLAVALAALALAACGAAANSAEQTEVPLVVDEFSVIADGRLAPSQFVQLSFQAGGEIQEVLVEEGDVVEAGQVLVRLGNRTQLEAARSAARLEWISAQQALEEIHEDAGVMTAQAQLDVADAQEQLRQADYRWSVQQEGQRASQATINAAEAQLILAKDALDRAKAVYDGVSGRAEDDLERALALTQFAAAQRDYDAALRNLRWYTGRPSETQQGLLDADLAMAQARLEQAQRVWEDRKDGPDADDLALAEARLAHAQAQWSAAEAALSDAELKAPMAGTVAHVLSKAGETAVPGQPAVVIADFTRWIVETENLSEIDLPQVLIGQAVTVAFDALPDVKLAGSVTAIRPLFEIKSGDVVYTVTIGLSEVDPRLQWGMTAVVTFEALAEAAAPGG